ncbi:AraC family transcriptional regulator [Acinetobacter sp.]|jgi:AraC-like DNA-binding protein|uniref:AraC family transcriptional regulator n=1 Tax=Acinetobacter sp. TaxID=472 RepID=UPI00281ADA4F|nr:AraC family transcriptional regulator [Acinetobacter sp.]MDR0235677.1 AraC family transcriptional regulator [Acinetobacter sp.]
MDLDFKVLSSQHVLSLIKKLAPSEGYTQSIIENVTFMRSDHALKRMPTLYEPSIVIVLQGRKRGFYNEEQYVYDANNYLVVSVPLPFDVETEATVNHPMLGIVLRIDLVELAELILILSKEYQPQKSIPKALYASRMDDNFTNAVFRLIEILNSPVDAKILGSSIYKEILYRVLSSEQGNGLRELLFQNNSFGKIAKTLQHIHTHYDQKIDVHTLAKQVNLSIPAFHTHFKTVTSTSPMQYIKTIRLHKARLMMIRENFNVEDTARCVGYESVSQFSREFKRLFGSSPIEEVKNLKTILSLST